jgi:hypothetical protein
LTNILMLCNLQIFLEKPRTSMSNPSGYIEDCII